jgi:predicted AAA+ superfamily ATPase
MKEIFKRIITDFSERTMPFIVERDLVLPEDTNKVCAIIGARRTGKTYLLYALIKKLRAKKNNDQIVYINFEDDRLFPLGLKNLSLFIDAYYELFPHNKKETVYFLFDEVQVVEKWELFIRRLQDTENCRIFIAGSSSKLLSKEISTSLRGRTISFELFTLNFSEFLRFGDIKVNLHSSQSLARIKNSFEKYLTGSSLPEIYNIEDSLKLKSMQEYLDLVIYKDIVERYQVSNLFFMKYLVKFLFSNTANLISINKIFNDMKSVGMNISRQTVYEYITYLEDTLTIFSVPLYTRNIREQNRNPRKFYSMDLGLQKAVSISEDKGNKLENCVFLHLRASTDEVYYDMPDGEIDFCVRLNGKMKLINVCYDLKNIETRKREIKSLNAGMIKYKTKESMILTYDEESEIKADSGLIKVKPVWKWILQDQNV